jgi:hypothetical protein
VGLRPKSSVLAHSSFRESRWIGFQLDYNLLLRACQVAEVLSPSARGGVENETAAHVALGYLKKINCPRISTGLMSPRTHPVRGGSTDTQFLNLELPFAGSTVRIWERA